MLMNYVGFATWLSIGAAVFCLPYLRWKRPDMERPIKVHLVRLYSKRESFFVCSVLFPDST